MRRTEGSGEISHGDDVQADGLRAERGERLRARTACGSSNEISRDEQRCSSKTQLGFSTALPPRLNRAGSAEVVSVHVRVMPICVLVCVCLVCHGVLKSKSSQNSKRKKKTLC